ncbi:MAG: hypothetical protein ACM35G_06875, partial [Planctomycetaceae bacterium]
MRISGRLGHEGIPGLQDRKRRADGRRWYGTIDGRPGLLEIAGRLRTPETGQTEAGDLPRQAGEQRGVEEDV